MVVNQDLSKCFWAIPWPTCCHSSGLILVKAFDKKFFPIKVTDQDEKERAKRRTKLPQVSLQFPLGYIDMLWMLEEQLPKASLQSKAKNTSSQVKACSSELSQWRQEKKLNNCACFYPGWSEGINLQLSILRYETPNSQGFLIQFCLINNQNSYLRQLDILVVWRLWNEKMVVWVLFILKLLEYNTNLKHQQSFRVDYSLKVLQLC